MARWLCCWVPVTSVLPSWNTVNNKHINTHNTHHTPYNNNTESYVTSHSVLVKTFRRRNLLHRAEQLLQCCMLCWECRQQTRVVQQQLGVSVRMFVTCHREGINNVAAASGFCNKCLICNFVTTQINTGSKHYLYQPLTQDPQHKLLKAIEPNRSTDGRLQHTGTGFWTCLTVDMGLMFAVLHWPENWTS